MPAAPCPNRIAGSRLVAELASKALARAGVPPDAPQVPADPQRSARLQEAARQRVRRYNFALGRNAMNIHAGLPTPPQFPRRLLRELCLDLAVFLHLDQCRGSAADFARALRPIPKPS